MMDAIAPNSTAENAQENPVSTMADEESRQAAILIQKTFRGHRTRRQLKGFGLDASTRWYEVGLMRANKCKSAHGFGRL
jgi:hypothetical protein